MALFTCTSEVLRQGRSSQNLAWCGTHMGRWGGRSVTGQYHFCGYVATVGTLLPWAHHPHGHITLWALHPVSMSFLWQITQWKHRYQIGSPPRIT